MKIALEQVIAQARTALANTPVPTALTAKEEREKTRDRYTQLLAQVLTQLAHTYTHYLAFLRHDDVAQALAEVPEPIKIDAATRQHLQALSKDLERETAPQQVRALEEARARILREEVEKIYAVHASYLARARTEANSLTSWPATEKAEVEYRLYNTEGYATYRHAEWMYGPGQDEEFREACRRAIVSLEHADRIRPNQYAVLENLGMIYLDRRFDPSGEYLVIAERYFRRAAELKPNDYYCHEELALIQERKLQLAGVLPAMLPEIQRGMQDAERAIALRPTSGASHLRLAELGTMEWELADTARRQALEPIVRASLQQAQRLRSDDPQFWSAQVRWLQQRLRYAEAAAADAKKAVLAAVDNGIRVCLAKSTYWAAVEVCRELTSVRATLTAP